MAHCLIGYLIVGLLFLNQYNDHGVVRGCKQEIIIILVGPLIMFVLFFFYVFKRKWYWGCVEYAEKINKKNH